MVYYNWNDLLDSTLLLPCNYNRLIRARATDGMKVMHANNTRIFYTAQPVLFKLLL